MSEKRCSRCGKKISYWHYIDGLPVCVDDRTCVLDKYFTRKEKKLRELKSKYFIGSVH